MKTWNEFTIRTMAEQINAIDNIVDMDTLLRAVNIKMCHFAKYHDKCIGCHYISLCRTIHDFLESNQARPEDFEEDYEEDFVCENHD